MSERAIIDIIAPLIWGFEASSERSAEIRAEKILAAIEDAGIELHRKTDGPGAGPGHEITVAKGQTFSCRPSGQESKDTRYELLLESVRTLHSQLAAAHAVERKLRLRLEQGGLRSDETVPDMFPRKPS